MPSLPLDQLRSGSPDQREAAAVSLAEIALTTPSRLHGSLGHLADALDDDCDAVRRAVANAIREVAIDEPTAVSAVAEPLVEALTDEVLVVRKGVARPLAALAGERPQRMRFAIDRLVPSLTDTEAVRTEIALALGALAPRYPEAFADHLDALTRALLDDYPPVQGAILRVLTPLERTTPGVFDPLSQRLRALVTAEQAGVRQAACRAIAANDPPWARDVLRERARDDTHPIVRETAAESETRVQTVTHTTAIQDGSTPQDVFTETTRGDWVVIRLDRDDELAALVGTVTAIMHAASAADETERNTHGLTRAAFESRQAWLEAPRIAPTGERTAVHLHNPFRDYGVNLLELAHGIGAEYTSGERAVPSLHRPEEIERCSVDRARLLAARVGDTLTFELEGATHQMTVVTAVDEGETDRVVGRNHERGYQISFRPLAHEPMMAVFEQGRAFRARSIKLD